MEAIVFLGILGILGSIASDRLWPSIRRCLQPALQLSDPENKRLKLSRTDAIKALWAETKYIIKDLKIKWKEEHGFGRKAIILLGIMSGNRHQVLRPMDTAIELRFGIFAVLNIVSFVVLGIFIPVFLAEGLQGEPIVQSIKGFPGAYFFNRIKAIMGEGVRERVSWDFKTCVTDSGVWSRTRYCVNLRNAIPPHKAEDIDLTDPIFTKSPYRFLSESGDAKFMALRLGRDTSLQDIAFNKKQGGKKLLHELTCIPIPLDRFITQGNESFDLTVKDLIPSSFSRAAYGDSSFIIHDSMILKTSNTVGSGHEIYGSKFGSWGSFSAHTEPIMNRGDQGATWYQTGVDATLPWLEFKGTTYVMQNRVEMAVSMVRGRRGSRLQNFLITFKPGESPGSFESPANDPIFEAHYPWGTDRYVADREVSALGCAEVFKLCSADECTDLLESGNDIWVDLCYPGMMSVWLSALIDTTYGDSPLYSRLRNFFNQEPNHRQRWQDDVEERFIRSILRVRYASKYAAEQDFVDPISNMAADSWAPVSLLFRNPDYTNVNFWGSIATAGGYLHIIAASYWLVLLSPLLLSLKFLSRAGSTGLEKFKVLIVFGGSCFCLARSVIINFVVVNNSLGRRRSLRSNILRMNRLDVPQENEEPENPTRMARNHGT